MQMLNSPSEPCFVLLPAISEKSSNFFLHQSSYDMSSWNNFTKPTVLRWIFIPSGVSLAVFLYSLKHIKPKNYLDVSYLGLGSILRIYAGFVHCVKSDAGLTSIAKMEQKVFDKHRYPLMLGFRQWGQMDVAVGLLKLYTIYFRPDFVSEMIGFDIAFQIGSILLTLFGISAEERKEIKQMVPNAPGQKKMLIQMSMMMLYIGCKAINKQLAVQG